jgi:hypothetical protein
MIVSCGLERGLHSFIGGAVTTIILWPLGRFSFHRETMLRSGGQPEAEGEDDYYGNCEVLRTILLKILMTTTLSPLECGEL